MSSISRTACPTQRRCSRASRLAAGLFVLALAGWPGLGTQTSLADNQLTGTIIGTSGSWNDSGNTREKAMDGSLATFFDAPVSDNAWVGLDLGANAAAVVSRIQYCPRSGNTGRMVGGKFQGSSAADFSDALDLFTLASAPPTGVLTAQTISVTNAFRYLRYLSPTNGWGNVAEVQFYTAAPPPPPPTFGVYRELWTGLGGGGSNPLDVLTNTTLNTNWPNNPNSLYTRYYTNFETETNSGMSNYGQRLRAFVVPPASGAYTFWIASDDASALFLSSDENSANKTQIANVNVWTDPREWTKEPNQKSAPIALEAGRRYYLEALMQQGGGGDAFAVRWQLPNGTIEEPISATSPAGTRLIPCGNANSIPGIFLQPANKTIPEHSNAVFSVLVTNQGPVSYQWLANGANVPDANRSVLTVSNASVALNNGQIYRCVASNISGSVTSAPALLTVIPDNIPPTLLSAGNAGLATVLVRFSEPVEPASATNAANYTISPGVAIYSVSLADPQTVRLAVSSLALYSNYLVTVSNVRDQASAPNTIAPNSQISFTPQSYGLETRGNLGPFLGGQLPDAAPAISGNWSAVVAFTNLLFTNALGFAALPDSDRVVVWEREGRVYSFQNAPGAGTKTLVLDISNQCQGWDDSGLLNLVFHPGFATNHYMFVYYTWVTPGTVVGSPTSRPPTFNTGKYHDRLSRFTLDESGVAIPGSELVLIDQPGDCVWHNGSGMFFHPGNGFLYVTDGDDENTGNTQIITNNLFSGVWRIDVDQRGGAISHPIVRHPANGTTANYYIPNDNPFVGQPNALEEFYCIGLRSPHRMTYDAPSGRIFLGDVGDASREELDVIEPGDPAGLNFQWSRIEGLQGDLTPPYIGINKRPLLDYTHSEGNAIIAGYVYRGSEFAQDLGGRYIFGDNVTKKVWVLDETTSPPGKTLLCVLPTGSGPNSGSDYTGLSSFGLDQNNELYLCQMSSVGGHIYKLARSGQAPPSRPFPPLLSQTGAFQDVASFTPDGNLVPYNVNSPLWSDGAVKHRWVAVPTNSFIHFTPTGEWTFPVGTVFMKHFELPVDDTNPNILRRLETRLLARDTNGAVYGMTYRWRTNYEDADLVTNALTEDIVIHTAIGTRTQQWYYPSPADCLRCHTSAAGYVLGVKTRQLNGDLAYPGTGVTDNQLRAWNHAGLFDALLSETDIPNFDHLVSVTNANATLTQRVRSYLDSNCSQCHRPGDAPAFWDARYDTPLAQQNIVNGIVGSSLGIDGAKVVAPQDLARSILYLRVNTLESFRMPPLARNAIDSNAVPAIAAWINSLSPPTISPIADVLVNSNSSTGPLSFTVGSSSADPNSLLLTASSSNPALVPDTNIVFGGGGANRTVTVTPLANQGGVATITITVSDGQTPVSETFDVAVQGALAAYYRFDGDALDSSGNGNDGTLVGGTSFAAGKVGANALQTDGSSGYARIPVSIKDDFTISLWLKTTDTGDTGDWWEGKGIVDGEVSGGTNDFGLTLLGGTVGFGIGNPDTTIASIATVNDGNWHHVAATRNAANGQMKVYVDGSLQATGTGPTASRSGPPYLRIGSLQTGTSFGFLAGTLDDVKLYNYVLNAAQIGGLANTPPVLAPIADRLIIAGNTLRITNSATDADLPPQTLTYSLVGPPAPPAGASLNASNGIFIWRPAIAQSGTTNLFHVQVADNGAVSQSATQSFFVTVNRPAQPGLTNALFNHGQFTLLISGDAGPDYTVQASTNLVDWIPLWTTNSPPLPFLFSDPSATSNYNQRFYRVLLGP